MLSVEVDLPLNENLMSGKKSQMVKPLLSKVIISDLIKMVLPLLFYLI